jgi:hypothetical protein
VIATAERPTELGEAALQALLAEVHRHVTSEGDRLVTIFGGEVARANVEVVAHETLHVLGKETVLSRVDEALKLA